MLQRAMERVPGDVLRMRAEDRLLRASILDFKPRLENRCKLFPENILLPASILDFMGSIWESLQGYARLRPLVCSDSGFQGVNLGITARLLSVYASCVQRFFI